MGDFVGFRGGECGRCRAMISAIVFGGAQFWTAREGARGHGGRFWVRAVGVIVCGARAMGRFSRTCRCARWALSGARCAEGKKKKVHPTRKVQSDEPKIENMDGCLTKSEHGVGASSALVLRLCRGTAARRGVVVWTMAEERRRATARWWFFGRKRGRLTGVDYCLLAYGLYRLA